MSTYAFIFGPRWCFTMDNWTSLLNTVLSMLTYASFFGLRWCFTMDSWTSLVNTVLSMMTYASFFGPRWCFTMDSWTSLVNTVLSMLTYASFFGPRWCFTMDSWTSLFLSLWLSSSCSPLTGPGRTSTGPRTAWSGGLTPQTRRWRAMSDRLRTSIRSVAEVKLLFTTSTFAKSDIFVFKRMNRRSILAKNCHMFLF